MSAPALTPDFHQFSDTDWASRLVKGHQRALISPSDALVELLRRYCREEEVVLGQSSEEKVILLERDEAPAKESQAEVAFYYHPQTTPESPPTELKIYYRKERFRPETVAQWGAHFLTLLGKGIEADFLSEQERTEVLSFAGHWSQPIASEETFPAQFQRQAQATPDAVALWCEGTEWSYRRLDEFSNQLAHLLIAKGVTIGHRVGVHLERRPEFLGTLLGIMKAGAGYVPLEPDLPEARRDFMVRDAKIEITVDDPLLRELASSSLPLTAPTTTFTSESLAYVIYTSGSTGEPKGVEIPHRALVDFCQSMNQTYELGAGHTWLAITTIAFDACIMELFPLLLCGGRVALAPPKLGSQGEALSALIAESRATHLWATPTTLRILTGTGWQGSPDLTIFSGGEAVDRDIAETVLPLCRALINGYGPTETTVFATNHLITSGDGPVPLGRPMDQTTIYLLDDEGRPVPPLARGRLWIGGQGLALGYLDKPKLTAEKFVPDPFSPHPGARMYDSGDVAYWDREGLIYYLGRSDHQVKLRGYRIELGEIEARLTAHPALRDAAVIIREDRPSEQRLVAYLIAQDAEELPSDQDLQAHLAKSLPEYMIPNWFIALDEFPVTAGLKLNRLALPAPPEEEILTHEDEASLAEHISSLWARILGHRGIASNDPIFQMGANSLNALRFQHLLEKELSHKVSTALIFQHPTAQSLADYLEGKSQQTESSNRQANDAPIAVIGMACRFPGAPNIDAYWDLLKDGKEAVQTFNEEELAAAGVSRNQRQDPDYVPRGTVLDKAHDFDPAFFGVSRPDASILSPQFRIFLTNAWETLEHAGYPEEPAGQPIGIFAGSGNPDHLAATRDQPEQERLQVLIGNGADFLTTRTSYALGLTGPAVSIQTACSTSLVAIAEAVYALRAGRCSMALAGGVSFSWPEGQGYLAGEGLIYSRSGHCRPFDSRADGTLFGQGVGTVLLKPLDQALADGDTIHAVIKGVATNNDGNRKGGYSAPSIAGQSDVIRAAITDAGISARDIGYVEAHGTATKIGDPIEVAGLTTAFENDTHDRRFCALGSVKGNIGHIDAAAGVAGFLKVVLSLRHRKLLPTLHFEKPNPEINFEDTPFQVQTQLADWPENPTDNSPRTAGLSAFGMGGTNAHTILQEAPEQPQAPQKETSPPPWQILPLSARSEAALEKTIARHQNHNHFAHAAFTLQNGRKHFSHRAIAILDKEKTEFKVSPTAARQRETVFLFTGQGAQYLRMGEALYQEEPVFRAALDQCDRLLPQGLLSWLFPKEGEDPIDINQTNYTQTALFSLMWAQAALWKSWGVTPAQMVGHSIGEYVAATLAGVFTLEDALKVVSLRSQLMQSMEPGSMLSVPIDSTRAKKLLERFPALDLAVENAPNLCVLAGPDTVIEQAANELKDEGLRPRKLQTSHGFHSRMMEPMLAEFTTFLQKVPLSAPEIPYGSNVTGKMITTEQATSPNTTRNKFGAQYASRPTSTLFLKKSATTSSSKWARAESSPP